MFVVGHHLSLLVVVVHCRSSLLIVVSRNCRCRLSLLVVLCRPSSLVLVDRPCLFPFVVGCHLSLVFVVVCRRSSSLVVVRLFVVVCCWLSALVVVCCQSLSAVIIRCLSSLFVYGTVVCCCLSSFVVIYRLSAMCVVVCRLSASFIVVGCRLLVAVVRHWSSSWLPIYFCHRPSVCRSVGLSVRRSVYWSPLKD